MPNANKIMRNLVGHAKDINLDALADILVEAFDADLRNGYAHADYVIAPANGEIRLPRRNKGGSRRRISYDEFALLLNKAIAFFETLWRAQGGGKNEPRRTFNDFYSIL